MKPRAGGKARGGRRKDGRKYFFRRRKVCKFCADKIDYVDYKDVKLLSGFVPERGKILPRPARPSRRIFGRRELGGDATALAVDPQVAVEGDGGEVGGELELRLLPDPAQIAVVELVAGGQQIVGDAVEESWCQGDPA